jgi:hypothetical protein
MNDLEQFEAWARTCDGNCSDNDLRKYSAGDHNCVIDGLEYTNPLVQRDWLVWQAARATPAQPEPTFEVTEIHGTARVNPYGDKPHVTGYYERTYTIPAQPSPSSVGAAITDQKITDLAEDYDIGRSSCGCRLFRDRHLIAFSRALLSEAAALAEQVQGQQVPEDYVLMPRRLTAENGAKSLMLGEFKESIDVPCMECCDQDDDYACETCENYGTVAREVPIGWDMIKRIYALAVRHLAAPSIAQDGQKSEGEHG